MELSKELLEATKRLYYSDSMVRKLKEIQTPKLILEPQEKILKKRKKIFEKLGGTTEIYYNYCKEEDINQAIYDVSNEYSDKCLTRMFFSQKHINDIDFCPHPENYPCSPFCKYFKEATPEQRKTFEHGIDLITGEELDFDLGEIE